MNVANNVSGRVYETYKGINDYFYLRRISDSLVVENAHLWSTIRFEVWYKSGGWNGTGFYCLKRLRTLIIYGSGLFEQNSETKPANLIYLDRGRLQAVGKQMGVINPNGIVGQVVHVTDNYAAVMSVLSKDFKISAKFKKNQFFGNLHWDGLNSTTAILEDIPKHVPVKVGDTIVTSGFSQLFPCKNTWWGEKSKKC